MGLCRRKQIDSDISKHIGLGQNQYFLKYAREKTYLTLQHVLA